MKKLFIAGLLISLMGCTPQKADIEYTNGALPPDEAIKTLSLPPGFKIELFAAEPLIADPVDMTIDENGNVYVVEMHGYPLDKSGKGKVKLLKDSDGDGTMDESIVFADGLTWPFGIMRWKNGVIVADAPHILYLEDTDGDGISDKRDTILTGFAFSNAQMNVGGPIYGMDNWIYLASEAGGTYQLYKDLFGDQGGEIYFPGNPGGTTIPTQGSGRTIRFKPVTYEMEQTSGVTQFNRTFDQWGRHLLNNNSNHIYHEVIAAPYLNRNKNLLVPNSTKTLSDHGSKVYSITSKPERQLLTSEGVFTSACGITAYKGGSFPAPYNQNITFVAEPVSNIVHVDLLEDDKSSFTAKRIDTPTGEFLASTDFWFRPVNMYVGPDGALYVLDYYRQIIEHPEWMSEEAVESGDLFNGNDMGRIYRITYEGSEGAAWNSDLPLGDKSTAELITYLSHPNSWWRMNAQRLLIDRNDRSAGAPLKSLVEISSDPLGRLHALWTLDGMHLMDQKTIEKGLKDEVPGVRENAIQIAEHHIESYPQLFKTLAEMKDDPDSRVRFQLLCTLGYDDLEESKKARYDILQNDMDDPWIQIAALSAASFKSADILEEMIEDYNSSGDKTQLNSLIYRLSELLVTGEENKAIESILATAVHNIETGKQQGWEPTLLSGLSQGLNAKKKAIAEINEKRSILLAIFLHNKDASNRKAAFDLLRSIGISGLLENNSKLESDLVSMVHDKGLPGERRGDIVEFISLAQPQKQLAFFEELINPEEDAAVQLAALNALNRLDGIEMSHFVITNWEKLSPQIRSAAVQAHLSSADQVNLFLDAIEKGSVQKSSVDFYRRVRFMTYADDAIKRRARGIFSQKEEGEINEEYQAALDIKGDKEAGKEVFKKSCAICHSIRTRTGQVDGELGTAIGPDLNTVYSWSPEGIMSQVLFPNSSVAVGYELWAIELNDGDKIQGVIADESPTAITVRNVGMEDRVVSRTSIKSLKSMDYSMMPGGFDEIIGVEEMADLIAFLKNR